MTNFEEDLLWLALCARVTQRLIESLKMRNLPTTPAEGEKYLPRDAAIAKFAGELDQKAGWLLKMMRRVYASDELNAAVDSLEPHIDSALDNLIKLTMMKLSPDVSVKDLLWNAWNHGSNPVHVNVEMAHFKSWYTGIIQSQEKQLEYDPIRTNG